MPAWHWKTDCFWELFLLHFSFFDDRLTLCEQTKVDAKKVKITVTDTHTQVELSFFLAVTVSVMLVVVVVNDDCDGWVINGT